MRPQEEREVVLNLEIYQAERIETAFRHNDREIARVFESAIRSGYAKDAAAKEQAEDRAKIPVVVKLTHAQARTTLNRYREYLDSPTDQKIYLLIDAAMK